MLKVKEIKQLENNEMNHMCARCKQCFKTTSALASHSVVRHKMKLCKNAVPPCKTQCSVHVLVLRDVKIEEKLASESHILKRVNRTRCQFLAKLVESNKKKYENKANNVHNIVKKKLNCRPQRTVKDGNSIGKSVNNRQKLVDKKYIRNKERESQGIITTWFYSKSRKESLDKLRREVAGDPNLKVTLTVNNEGRILNSKLVRGKPPVKTVKPLVKRKPSNKMTIPLVRRKPSNKTTIPLVKRKPSYKTTIPLVKRKSSNKPTIPLVKRKSSNKTTIPLVKRKPNKTTIPLVKRKPNKTTIPLVRRKPAVKTVKPLVKR